jgi:hypothetical protein
LFDIRFIRDRDLFDRRSLDQGRDREQRQRGRESEK